MKIEIKTPKSAEPMFVLNCEDNDIAKTINAAIENEVLMPYADLSSMTFPEHSVIKNGYFSAANFSRCIFNDVTFVDCNFSFCTMLCANAHLATFVNCNFTGAEFQGSCITDSTFAECLVDDADFRVTSLNGTHFVNCKLKSADFRAAHMTDVTFDEDCITELADFRRTVLYGTEIDIRSNRKEPKTLMEKKTEIPDETCELIPEIVPLEDYHYTDNVIAVTDVSITYETGPDCTEGEDADQQTITFETRDNGTGRFIHIKTDGWSVDGIGSLIPLFEDFQKRAGIK